MKVLFVCHAFPPRFSGAATQAIYLAHALKRVDGTEAEFFIDGGDVPGGWESFEGLRVFRARSLRQKNKAREFLYTLKMLFFVLRHPEYRVVHFHCIQGVECLAFPFIRLSGRKIVYHITLAHSDDPLTLKKRALGPFFGMGLSCVHRFIAISTKLVEMCRRAGVPSVNVVRIPSGVDLERFRPASAEEKNEEKAFLGMAAHPLLFLSVGRIETRKGQDFLLDAWKRLQTEFPGSALFLAGPANDDSNPFYRTLEEKIRAQELKNVFFGGKREGVESCMRAADCFLFASTQEGFGNVFI